MKSTILLSTLLIASCALSPERISTADSVDLCERYSNAFLTSPEIKAELIRRNAITDREWQAINEQTVFVGMSEAALACSWGIPDRVNKIITNYGATKQWVYRYPGYNVTQYGFAYTQNGKVIAVHGR
jgi:hypothetical protein